MSSCSAGRSINFVCHTGLALHHMELRVDPESGVLNWIPAFAGMTASEIM